MGALSNTLNILATKYLDKKIFDYIYPWAEKLVYIAWEIRAAYHRPIEATSGKSFFGRYMIFNLMSVIEWLVITSKKQQQVEIDNF